MNEEKRRELLEQLKELKKDGDTEGAHDTADSILCEALELLGYYDIVKEYDEIEK